MTNRILAVLACSALLITAPSFGQGPSKSFLIDTRPTGALVFVNGAESGTTPFKYAYTKTPSSPVTVELRKEGYTTQTVDLSAILKQQFAAKRPLMVNLYLDPPSDRQRTDLPIVTLTNSLPQGKKELGHIGSHKLYIDARELDDLRYPEQLTADVLSALRNSFASSALARLSTQKGDEAIRRAKVYLKPVIKDVRMELEENDDRVFGNVEIDMG